jgi:hypothetical protein
VPQLRIPGVIGDSACAELDYAALVRWVSQRCPPCPRDPCIPLANLRLQCGDDEAGQGPAVDITVRPICFANDLLFQLVLGLIAEPRDYRTEK